MLLVLGVFVVWLALQGRLKVYADFATAGPGLMGPNAGQALGGASGGLMGGYQNPNLPAPPMPQPGQYGNNPTGQSIINGISGALGKLFGGGVNIGGGVTLGGPSAGPPNNIVTTLPGQ